MAGCIPPKPAHKVLPITATEQSRWATAINRKVYRARQSPVRKQVRTWAERAGGREGRAEEEALELSWKNSYKLGMLHYIRSSTQVETTEQRSTWVSVLHSRSPQPGSVTSGAILHLTLLCKPHDRAAIVSLSD